MKISMLAPAFGSALIAGSALAFPPAPYHTVYGTVRDELGRPLSASEGTVELLDARSAVVVSAATGADGTPGENYRLRVPIDSGIDARLYQVNSMRPALPFTMRVTIGGVAWLPIEMSGAQWAMGDAARETRLDLSLGIDSDGDGLPDAWERSLLDSDTTGRYSSLADIHPHEDADGDGMSNLQEYLVGTYALDRLDVLELQVVGMDDAFAELRFTAVAGHTYRIRSSEDALTWTDEPFASSPSAEPRKFLRAGDVRIVNAFVPREFPEAKKLYRLYVD